MAEISFICKRTVVSTKPVQPGKSYSLSVLDRSMETSHLRIVCYFQSLQHRERGELTKTLRESISVMLSCFPVVTGRLQKNFEGHWMIKCNDAGVRMVEARVKGTVEEWLQRVDREKELKLVHWEDMYDKPYFWSTFYVQLTEFEEGGLAVGLSCSHLLADPVCATMFIKAWADTNLAAKMLSPPLFHPLPPRRPGNKNINHKPYIQLINYYKSSMEQKPVPVPASKCTTVTLAFAENMVQACMAMARAGNANDGSIPSPFEALAGLFWVCLSKGKGMGEGLINMSVGLDMRNMLGLDKGFFGNCMIYNKVHGRKCPLDKEGLPEAAKAIGKVVSKMDTEGIMDLLEWMWEHDSNDQCAPSMSNHDLVCTNLETIDPYSAMFEEGVAPLRVSYYIEPMCREGHVFILPSPGEGPLSRVVMVTLPEDEALRLCEDDFILHFSPTILMGVSRNNA
ncbi:protein ECERIFERUM 26-like isoform X2 [Malania oleifera]|nr:protein ECERIFERUM 26-like isoform X2 [Malania oleifera]